jgi:protein ImuA
MAGPLHSREIDRVVQSLAEQVRAIEVSRRPTAEGLVSSGHAGLDRLLPEGGFRRGSLVEWLASGPGSGAATLALATASQAARQRGALVVVDRRGLFYPPAAVNLGIDPRRLIVVRPENDEDHAWALDQTLRWRGVAAVWCCPQTTDAHTLRRWQLAAETGGALGLLVRSEAARDEPSWAELRLAVTPLPAEQGVGSGRRLRVELVRARGGRVGAAIELELTEREGAAASTHDDNPMTHNRAEFNKAVSNRGAGDQPGSMRYETGTVHLASPLAPAKTRRRARGA